MLLRPDWSPMGAKRILELVTMGWYDGAVFFRALRNFVVQWGMKPASDEAAWKHQHDPARVQTVMERLKDEPVKTSNTRGTLTFAMGGKNTRTHQLFINLKDNHYLDREGFSPVGEVVEGMDLVAQIDTTYKDGQGQVASYHKSREALKQKFPLMWAIDTCSVL